MAEYGSLENTFAGVDKNLPYATLTEYGNNTKKGGRWQAKLASIGT